jgi:signal transduction histidine kinase
MEASLTDLRTPLETRPLERALRERAQELAPAAGVPITVHGRAPGVPAPAYRIACEALTNAVRHSGASRIDLRLDVDDRRLQIVVVDDGCGMPTTTRTAATGVRSMHQRARGIGGSVVITPRDDSTGTVVRLEVPITNATNGATP